MDRIDSATPPPPGSAGTAALSAPAGGTCISSGAGRHLSATLPGVM